MDFVKVYKEDGSMVEYQRSSDPGRWEVCNFPDGTNQQGTWSISDVQFLSAMVNFVAERKIP